MLRTVSPEEHIEIVEKPLSRQHIDFFRRATLSDSSPGIPLTFPTIFRRPEFDWLDRLKVDMHSLLHTEQEYEYLVPLEVGDVPRIRTRVKELKERKSKRLSLTIVVLESEVHCSEVLKMRTNTTFVLREMTEEN